MRAAYSLTPLHVAAELNRGESYVNQLEKLLSDGSWGINEPSRRGDAPLHLLLGHGSPKSVEPFLRSGADPGLRDRKGRSALVIAASRNKSADVARLLLDAGADVDDAAGPKSRTPLHQACMEVRFGVIGALLEYGADVGVVDDLGRTPLAYLLFNGLIRKLGGRDFLRSLELLLLHCGAASPFENTVLTSPGRFGECVLNPGYVACHADAWKIIMRRLAISDPPSPELVRVVERRAWFKAYYAGCLGEIDAAARTRLYGSVSFKDLLTRDLVDWVGNAGFAESFEASDYERAFPTYAALMRNRLRLARARRASLDAAARFLGGVVPNVEVVVRKIASYLGAQDVARLSRAARQPSENRKASTPRAGSRLLN